MFLNLSRNELSRMLPSSFAVMHKMREFSISSNKHTSHFPGALFTKWSQITSFQLQNNSLTSRIPPEVGMAKKLKILYLFSNNTRFLSPQLGELARLRELDLSTNSLMESIRSSLGHLKQLTVLLLYSNGLSGTMPTEMGNMRALQILNVGTNGQEGELPTSIARLKNLRYHVLLSNNLNGTIPSDLGKG
ncbi:hypothetical protein SETIT_7G018500v2 [Setaria italica]|uniref:Leucine-rich repeat-containing N-terminal plant-type domain-containing protein n=1 Tax=Setaria italica TaxID=4555 RepID=A0A368RR34_SETIT|nr:hypothetical protein SETIT_7G018500v2 [Setaria italica]